jgi:tyrosine-protein phosphatase SIW14
MWYSSLVNHDFPPEFKDFMTANGIRHCIVEMQGTKRVEIPDVVMNSIMEIALNKENHPLLIHCNHGKVPHLILTSL